MKTDVISTLLMGDTIYMFLLMEEMDSQITMFTSAFCYLTSVLPTYDKITHVCSIPRHLMVFISYLTNIQIFKPHPRYID